MEDPLAKSGDLLCNLVAKSLQRHLRQTFLARDQVVGVEVSDTCRASICSSWERSRAASCLVDHGDSICGCEVVCNIVVLSERPAFHDAECLLDSTDTQARRQALLIGAFSCEMICRPGQVCPLLQCPLKYIGAGG